MRGGRGRRKEQQVSERWNASLGRSVFRLWVTRKRLAETRRPLMTAILSRLVEVCSLALIAEASLLERVLDGDPPRAGGAGAFTAACGLVGLFGGARLERGGRLVAFLAWTVSFRLSTLGATLINRGRKAGSPALVAGGALNLAAGLAVADLLGVCWYTIDPLGLHWDSREKDGLSKYR